GLAAEARLARDLRPRRADHLERDLAAAGAVPSPEDHAHGPGPQQPLEVVAAERPGGTRDARRVGGAAHVVRIMAAAARRAPGGPHVTTRGDTRFQVATRTSGSG